MKLLLYFAAITRLTAASYLREAAPRSAGGLLFLNTTQATLSTSTESVSPTNVETISSAASGSSTTPPTTSKSSITSPIKPDSSSAAVTAPTSPGDLTVVGSSPSSSSTHAVEPTGSNLLTVVRGSLGVPSSPTVALASSSDLTMVHSSSNLGSDPAVEPPSSSDVTTTQGKLGLSSTYAAELTTSGYSSAVRVSLGPGGDPGVVPTNAGDMTTVQASPGLGSEPGAVSTTVGVVTAVQASSSSGSTDTVKSTTFTDLTAAPSRPSSIYSESEDKAGLASTATRKPEPDRSSTSAESVSTRFTEPSTAAQSSFVYSVSPAPLGHTTPGAPSSSWTLTLASAFSRTAHSAATSDATPPSRQDRVSGSVSTPRPPGAATTATLPAASKPQTAMHAVAVDANTTVESSLPIVPPLATSSTEGHVDVAETLTTVGTQVSSQAMQSSSSARRTSTASAVTLSSGGAVPTTIISEAASPTQGRPSGQLATPSQGLPRVILPNGSGNSSTEGRLIQLGFLFPLNYVFVSQHLQAAAQIFEVLPAALAHGTVQRSTIEVARLVPYDTQATAGYIATVAKLYYPNASVDQLQRDVLDPKSDIYTRGEDMQKNLTALIDPTIKVTDDNGGMDCAAQPCNASPDTSGSGSSKQTGITAGAVVGGAAVCGVLGLGVFQLYRRRGSAAWPFGEQNSRLSGTRISRPIGSVNSLGWNWLTDK